MRYTPGGGWQASTPNQLIFNFKKPKDLKNQAERPHKEKAVAEFIATLAPVVQYFCKHHKQPVALMSILTSKIESDPDYGDGLDLVGESLKGQLGDQIQLESPIANKKSQIKSSQSKNHRNRQLIDSLKTNFRWSGFNIRPQTLLIYDDVITTGAHFVATREFIYENMAEPHRPPIFGLFWAKAWNK